MGMGDALALEVQGGNAQGWKGPSCRFEPSQEFQVLSLWTCLMKAPPPAQFDGAACA